MELTSKDQASVLDPVPFSKQLDLKFTNINLSVILDVDKPSTWSRLKTAVGVACPRCAGENEVTPQPTAQKKQILYNITGEAIPGEVFSLMGPSGSGKTSLLSVISGRTTKKMEVDGQVTCRGAPLLKHLKRRFGYVMQDDLLYDTLTVEETLLYSAMLWLPNSTSQEEKQALVDSVITALGLNRCRSTMIGGQGRRGISGGERKRTSIGHELILNPSILMLDEPTSGLDSTIAYHLLITLSQLAAGGRCIITTIHQPSSRMYQLLDKLMLLAEGRTLYYGSAAKVTHWFSHFGFEMPFGINTADFILDLATGQIENGVLSGSDGVEALTTNMASFLEKNPRGFYHVEAIQGYTPPAAVLGEHRLDVVVLNSDGQPMVGQAELDPKMVHVVEVDEHTLSRLSEVDHEYHPLPHFSEQEVADLNRHQSREGANYIEQCRVLLIRAVKVRRFEALSVQRFLTLNVVAVLTGLFWFQKGQHFRLVSAQDVVGLLFFEQLFPAFSVMFTALFTFPQDYRMLLKERASGMYQLSAYYFSRLLSDLPMDCVYPTVFVTIIYWMGGLRQDAGSFFSNLLSLLLIVFLGQSIGLLTGALFMNPKQAQTVLTVIMLSCMLIGGYYVRGIPYWIEWSKYISFVYWGFNLLLKIEYRDRSFRDCTDLFAHHEGLKQQCTGCFNGTVLTEQCDGCIVYSGHQLQDALGLQISVQYSVWPELVVLFGMLISLRVAIYCVLRWRTSAQFRE